MENTKDYNFFYVKEKDNTLPLKVIITSALGEGKYTFEEMSGQIKKVKQKNTEGKLILYQDDGEIFWNISQPDGSQLDIGTKEDNYAKWDSMKNNVLSIEIEDLLVFCHSKDSKDSKDTKVKKRVLK